MIKHILLILSLFLFGCEIFITNQENISSDEELIEAIQNSSNKETVNIEQLPIESMEILQETYFDNLVLNSMIAPEYGYEISLGTVESSIGNIREIYFALEGRELRSEREEHNQERECFNLVYPLTFSMPDGTEIVVDHHQDWDEIRQWYEQNPDATERYFQYPVNIIYEDGTIVSIANEENLIQAYEDCGQ